MPRIRFYNRRSRHEHPWTPHLRRPSAERRGKTRQRSTFRILSGGINRAERDARPPRGHLASDSPALDGARPASGLATTTLRAFALRWGRAPRRFRPAAALSFEPSDIPFWTARIPDRRNDPSLAAGASFQPAARQCAGLPEPGTPSTGEDHVSPLARAPAERSLAWPDESCRRTCSSMFENID
jgi:hypothetical protein